jgi:hypothetical protein
MSCAESLLELFPGDGVHIWVCDLIVVPPFSSRTFKLVRGKPHPFSYLSLNCVQLLTDGAEPVIRYYRLRGTRKIRGIQPQKPSQAILPWRVVVVVIVIVVVHHLEKLGLSLYLGFQHLLHSWGHIIIVARVVMCTARRHLRFRIGKF